MNDVIAVSIAQATRASGIGRSTLYEAIKRGDLPIKKVGRRSLVLVDDLKSWLSNLPSSTAHTKRGRSSPRGATQAL